MQFLNWFKFLYALYQLYPQVKKIWDQINADYQTVKGSPAPSSADLKKIVGDALDKTLTDIAQVQDGLSGDGTVK